MKTTSITRKITALIAAAIMMGTVSVCASAEDKLILPPDNESERNESVIFEQHEISNIPRGGRIV